MSTTKSDLNPQLRLLWLLGETTRQVAEGHYASAADATVEIAKMAEALYESKYPTPMAGQTSITDEEPTSEMA